MKKKLFLRLCLILMVAITISSCRTDHFPEQEDYSNSSKFQLTSKRISLSEAKHKEKLFPELEKAEVGIESFAKNNAHSKIISYGNGVSIDTESVIYIENGPNYHTYTFNITRDNAPTDASIENLVLTPLPDGTYKELLISYNLTAQEKQSLLNGNAIDTKDKTSVTILADGTFNGNGQLSRAQNCSTYEETVWVTCSCNQHGSWNISEWGECEAPIPPKVYTVIKYKCNSIDDGSGTIGGGEPIGGGSGNGGGSDCTGNGVYINPTDPTTGLGDNPCTSGVPTEPNAGGNQEDPCTQLKNIKDKPGFTTKMTELKNNIPTGTQEKGFVIRDIPTQPFSQVVQGGAADGGVKYPFKETTPQDVEELYKTYGTAHNHLENNPKHTGTFTPEDVGNLFHLGLIETSYLNPYRTDNPDKAIVYVMTNKGLFALKINDFSKLSAFAVLYSDMVKATNSDNYDKFVNDFISSEKYNINHYSTKEQQITGFLRLMQDRDIGVDLYEGDKQTYGNWKKLTLVENVVSTANGYWYNELPCNL